MTSALQPRECRVTKKPQKTYGFFLRIEQDTAGHIIRNVGQHSPAQRAGLRDGDRVLRVNGVFVDKEKHAQVHICSVWDPHQAPITQAHGCCVKLFLPIFMARKSRSRVSCSELSILRHSLPTTGIECLWGASLVHEQGVRQHGLWTVQLFLGKAFSSITQVPASISPCPLQVVEMVKNSGNSVVLLVLDAASYEKAQKEGVNLEELGQKPSTGQQQEQQCPPASVANRGTTAVPQPWLCYLVKEETGYGFSLKRQKGLFIVELSSQGAAAKAGVQNNDRLIEINGKNVENDTHEEVVEKVKKSENHVMFLLSNEETDRYFTSQRMALSKENASLRLNLSPLFILEHVIKDVNSGSPAAMAGLKDNDILVAVNGERVDGLDHESVVGKIKQSEERTSLLVVDKETDSMYKLAQVSPFSYYYKAQDSTPAKTEESVELHTEQKVNHKPRICKMVKGPNGFGFSLNMIKNKPGLFITEVQSQGPAGGAGVENNDFLVEVNGVNVTNESYDKVVARIQSTGDRLTLLVCSKDAYRYFQGQNIPITASMAESDTSEPPAHTENHPSEPERNSPEPRERVTASTRADGDNSDDTKL
uniref:Na(+)/H(+) exchange regulatory cofactor NHE-RF3-like n=1 Tax=Cyanistes caeruleus TaxID=156563 RepID=A0A8C0VGN6_CYACU